jgi:hypothetical protein
MMYTTQCDFCDVLEMDVDGLFGSDYGQRFQDCGDVGGWYVGVGMVDIVVR